MFRWCRRGLTGVPNFVTAEGMDQLLREREELMSERESLVNTNENERRIAQNFINAKLNLLNERISEARLVEHTGQQGSEIMFGAAVTLKNQDSGLVQVFKITGVDEADVAKGKLSFISPMAKGLLNKKAGDRITLKRNQDNITYEILEVTYR